ncbi:hypothetical protein G6O69_16760 [Pseudenhygromyxa sp. WMMC2535]|uniref:hypothetical protein n=1 Tax=Pseudenhygromyxa sp. WMMC2535 TaxID=2712867 RepID=UPI0015569AAB|nr:hypothetical protein [Pseudenhygromyxa sp. WMMC2535]NVB39495.1 hypothetical protein [Pseudenhygromyxa sp. WMMC2535]
MSTPEPPVSAGAPEPSPIYRVSGIGRPVDPAYPTNKALLILMAAALVLGALWSLRGGASVGGAALAGLGAALLAFLSWALTRELSPDDDPAAFVAMALALAAWARVGGQSLMFLVVAMGAVRIVNRSTGKAAELADGLILVAIFSAMAWLNSWACGVVGALALALDAGLPRAGTQAARPRHLVFAGVVAAVTVARVVVGVEPLRVPAHLPVFGTIAGLALLVGLFYPQPRSRCDLGGHPLVEIRVRAGLLLAVLLVALGAIDGGVDQFELGALWACLMGVVLGAPVMLLRRR